MSYFAVAALVATAVGAGVSAYSAHESGKAQEEMGKYNADVASMAAASEADAAAENAKRQRVQNRRQMASIRARQAAGGINIGTGSSLDVLGTSASELEIQALDLFRDSDARQRQYKSQAEMSIWEGGQAKKAGDLQAAGSLISGFGSAAGGYSRYGSSGVIRTSGG